MFARKYAMIHSGKLFFMERFYQSNIVCRTLATDRLFKEKVREDMLVRLLDAFVWRNTGTKSILVIYFFLSLRCADVEDASVPGFTYVQGMNVLAAPFLYTMPSELEAFYCFSNFIEVMCPSYVQPTLEGVHRGLKVCGSKRLGSLY